MFKLFSKKKKREAIMKDIELTAKCLSILSEKVASSNLEIKTDATNLIRHYSKEIGIKLNELREI